RVKDTRAALVEQVRETGLILPAAQFALTEQESSDFAKKGSRYAYGDEAAADNEAGGDGGETVDSSVAPDDADVDQEEEDETADHFASPQHANLEGDLDDIAPPSIDAVDRVDAAYDVRA